MKKKDKGPAVPQERHETVRREIISVLGRGEASAKDISFEVRIPEKEVYEHLSHIRKTLDKKDHQLLIIPAECAKCGFVFSKRERLRKPGKCPVCKGESIREPLFSLSQ
ncbi:MAG: ArsR family transcriptional regulator [Nitrospiraceae bacterium]|nr:ArsR family transcriptional regulator [Nitrospiraceae bacterium]